ncbi:MAG TPA: 2-oxo-4-hydroxy-4-carboxy-5-ureidoimidazoline decarboxylase, partial [Vicinamibacterales bacterium]
RRGPGHDWAVVHLGIQGTVRRLELDTAHFKGNYPDTASVEVAVMPIDDGGVSADVSTKATGVWKTALPQTKLQPDFLHPFEAQLPRDVRASHVRLNIYPDGGVSRFRVLGVPDAEARRGAVLRQLNAMDDPEIRAELADVCAAPAWIDRMAASRPFATPAAVLAAADTAAGAVKPDDWREAFGHHPPIGARAAERPQSAAAQTLSAHEQSAVQQASPSDLAALAEGNRAYRDRFGYVFIVCATGRTAPEMLAMLRDRLNNDPETELGVAAGEQRRITRLRLERLFA